MFSWASSIFPLWIFIEVNSFKLICLLKFFIQLFVGNHLYFYKMKVRRWLKYEYIRLYVASFVFHALKCVCLLEMFIYKMSEVSRFSSSYNTNMSEEQRIFSIIDNHGAYLSIHKYKQERWFIFTCKRYDDKHCWKNFHHGKNDSIEENSSGNSKYKLFKKI